jgi:undecaprenyl-diphosphatase
MSWLDALILGIVEGITEFLPVSSTGHLILARAALGLTGDAVERMLIIIQGAAMLALCYEYRVRLWQTLRGLPTELTAQRFTLNLFIAFLPLAILGLAFEKRIKALLFKPLPVVCALIIGGVLILWAERRRHRESIHTVDEVRPAEAAKLGFFQALALIPGTSRSAATIIGGLLLGMTRRAATEFSFFLAIPTLLAATFYELWKARAELTAAETTTLTIGSIAAFLSALVTVRLFLRFLGKHSFAAFAYYRIGFGVLVLALWAAGWVAL